MYMGKGIVEDHHILPNPRRHLGPFSHLLGEQLTRSEHWDEASIEVPG